MYIHRVYAILWPERMMTVYPPPVGGEERRTEWKNASGITYGMGTGWLARLELVQSAHQTQMSRIAAA
jgi:hypothetical protein